MIIQEADYLAHVGVLGMKWGHRKSKVNMVGNTRIKKGTSIHRISSNKEITINDNYGKHAYAAFTRRDIDIYKAQYAIWDQLQRRDHIIFDIKFKASEDLISPNKKKRVDSFIKLHGKDPIISKEVAALTNYSEKEYANMSKSNLKTKGYDSFIETLLNSEYNRNVYFKDLKSQGYNMIIDDHDSGSFSNKPILIFNRSQSLSRISSKIISSDDIDKAKLRIDKYEERLKRRTNKK